MLQEFQEDFGLSVSREKTFLWGSERATLVPIAEKWGYSVRDTVVSLGAEWALHPSVKCSYDKEQKRLESARSRLARLAHLASPMLVKAAAILTGCLQCEQGPQNMHHLLYDCALSPPIPWGCLL